MSRRRPLVVIIVALAIVLAACGSSATTTAKPSSGGNGAGTPKAAYPISTELGQGVTATTIKLGVALIDFSCIRQYTDTIRENQNDIYLTYINDVNQHGGIAGRTIVPVFRYFCPIPGLGATAIGTCTKLTEDDKVFAVMGNMYDTSGDAQTCVAKTHKVPLLTFDLTRAIIKRSPGGYIVYAGSLPERVSAVVVKLITGQHTLNGAPVTINLLDGKTVAILAESDRQSTVKTAIEPGLKSLGVKTGDTGYLTLLTGDTTAAQSALDGFIEKWKVQGVNAIFLSGQKVASKQFVDKIRKKMPGIMLLADTTQVQSYGQEEKQAGITPNNYEGVITAGGPTPHEYDTSKNWDYCKTIYMQQHNGKTPPDAETVLKTSDGKKLDTYGGLNDACQLVTLFHDIGTKVGQYLNAPNWQYSVNNYGPIRNMGGGPYASLGTNKYDIDDTFRLEAFDSSIPPQGAFKPLTDTSNITGSG